MPFRERFDCLWCGTAHAVRTASDLEGWAQLCPACLGKAGTNAFLRDRLRTALAERGRSSTSAAPASPVPAPGASTAPWTPRPPRPQPPRPPARAFPDDWFLRRGAFERGAIHDTAWAAELDMVTRWLDGLPLAGRIDEPGAGTGFFSPLLADKGELHASDEDGGALDLARSRLVAHGLLAHLHVADPWAVPADGPADAVVASFLLGRVRGAGLDRALAALRARLRPGGLLAIVELRPDAQGGPPEGLAWTWHDPAVLEAALVRAGFGAPALTSTGRFFLVGSASAA
jgi:SAM-dependent methyltransferase